MKKHIFKDQTDKIHVLNILCNDYQVYIFFNQNFNFDHSGSALCFLTCLNIIETFHMHAKLQVVLQTST